MTIAIQTKFKGAKILVAEDFAFNREIILEMLKIMGIEADQVENGQEAVDMVMKKNYDLIIMDIRMPIKDGLTATKEIRSLKIEQPIVLALTASLHERDRHKTFEAGMNGYLSKPLKFATLEKTLRSHLGKFLVGSKYSQEEA